MKKKVINFNGEIIMLSIWTKCPNNFYWYKYIFSLNLKRREWEWHEVSSDLL